MPKVTRKKQRERQRKNFLDGVARRPHTHSRTLRLSLEEAGSSSTMTDGGEGVCLQCSPVLSRYATTFKEMVHTGTELKKRKKINPTPKRPESELTHYRDITRQNEWLRANMFDSLGNYLYCFNCIKSSFGISRDRLSHQRSIKRRESKEPVVEMTKQDVEEQRLGEFVIMPSESELSFKMWWRTVEPTETVNVRYPQKIMAMH